MTNIRCEYSKSKIDDAGARLLSLKFSDDDRDEVLKIVGNWRACHSYPLNLVTQVLRERAKKADRDALVAQRLKRLFSIRRKLGEQEHMRLSQMQDLGGCRVVVNDLKATRAIVRAFKSSKGSPAGVAFIDESKTKDYIAKPKTDGYRSIHLVARINGVRPELVDYNTQCIEIQIRTHLQHQWATTLETVEEFTKQALKAKNKIGAED